MTFWVLVWAIQLLVGIWPVELLVDMRGSVTSGGVAIPDVLFSEFVADAGRIW